MLVSPTTSDDRLKLIVDQSDEIFIYAVSQIGVTGTRSEVNSDLKVKFQNFMTMPKSPYMQDLEYQLLNKRMKLFNIQTE